MYFILSCSLIWKHIIAMWQNSCYGRRFNYSFFCRKACEENIYLKRDNVKYITNLETRIYISNFVHHSEYQPMKIILWYSKYSGIKVNHKQLIAKSYYTYISNFKTRSYKENKMAEHAYIYVFFERAEYNFQSGLSNLGNTLASCKTIFNGHHLPWSSKATW